MEGGTIRDANDAHNKLTDAEMLALHDRATSRGGTNRGKTPSQSMPGRQLGRMRPSRRAPPSKQLQIT
jgi:hypothetical protein